MKLHLKIINLDKEYFNGEVDLLNINTSAGELTILANHLPIITNIKVSHMYTINDKETTDYAIAGGTLFVNEEECKIITNAIESADEINEERANASKIRAEERINESSETIDMARAEASLKRAINRLSLLKK
ncbi:MAG: ATP synthase F1 subunit epsilon [Erysipelotrichales bacterium]|nr:ATP synthase F1 subunit epsilon [Erysipelotrichales bacterium]